MSTDRTLRSRVLATGLVSAVATVLLGAAASPADAGQRWRWHGDHRTPAAVSAERTTAVVSRTPEQVYEAEVLRLVNVERGKVGLRPLAASTCAQGYARSWSRKMASTGTFAHQSLRPIMTTCKARGAGENIAYGNVTAARMVAMWMGSPGHKANVLRASFTHLGVGAVRTSTGRWYGTQDFLTL